MNIEAIPIICISPVSEVRHAGDEVTVASLPRKMHHIYYVARLSSLFFLLYPFYTLLSPHIAVFATLIEH